MKTYPTCVVLPSVENFGFVLQYLVMYCMVLSCNHCFVLYCGEARRSLTHVCSDVDLSSFCDQSWKQSAGSTKKASSVVLSVIAYHT